MAEKLPKKFWNSQNWRLKSLSLGSFMKKVTKSLFSFPVYEGVKSIASSSTEPNDLSRFFPNIVFPVLCTATVVYKGEHKSTIQTISYQYDWHSITQLSSYHLPKFVAVISKKLNGGS